MHFNESKATAVATYFLQRAGGELADLKLMKLMYLAEREAFLQQNCGITGDSFYSMQNGPVLSETLRLMQLRPRLSAGEIWNRHVEVPAQWIVRLKAAFQEEVLSMTEKEILAKEWKEHGRKNKWSLVDLTHEFPEWDRRAEELKTSIQIPNIDILEALGLPKETVEARLSAMAAADYLDDLLDTAAKRREEQD